MTDLIRKSLRDSKTARWAALAIVSLTMFCGYFFADVMSPLKPMLEAAGMDKHRLRNFYQRLWLV